MRDAIAIYLGDKKERLGELYGWDFDPSTPLARFGISVRDGTWLEKTLHLKNELRSRVLAHRDNKVEQGAIAAYFIRDWGGIRGFSKEAEVVERFFAYIDSPNIPDEFFPDFESVSSWSKWAALVCPKWACIYDARVAYSINAINFLSGSRHKLFPMPEGRNSRLNLLDISTLVLGQRLRGAEPSDPKSIRKVHYVARADAYREYLTAIHGVSEQLWGDAEHIHEVEMLLFALADADVYEDVFRHVTDARV